MSILCDININTIHTKKIEDHFLIVSSVQRISLLYGFKTVQQTARAKEIIEGVKQFSSNSFGMAFIIILLIMTSSVSLAFHKFVYASVTRGSFFQSAIFELAAFVLISGIPYILKSAFLISFASELRRF